MPQFYDWLASYPGGVGRSATTRRTYSKEFDGLRLPHRRCATRCVEPARGLQLGNYGYYKITDFESSYVKALDLGWHVMPSANSDTHVADWITGYETCGPSCSRTRSRRPTCTPPCAPSRGYATLDKDLRVTFTRQRQR